MTSASGGEAGGPMVPAPVADVPEETFLGVRVALLDAEGAAEAIATRAPGLPFAYVVTPNAAHFIRLTHTRDTRLRAAYRAAWLRLLDGQGPRLLARLLFGQRLPHAAGSDTTDILLARYIRPDDPVTIIGGNADMPGRLTERFGLRCITHYNPPMGFIRKPDEVEACIDFVLAHPARYVFFVTGAPQSEYLAHMVAQRGGAVGVGLCVGSALNFSVGIVPRAPRLVRSAGMEWVYRFVVNPRGHARRTFYETLPILWIALVARLNPRAYGLDGEGELQ